VARQTKNVTFSLPVELIERFRNYAKQKRIPSINAGVREALEEYASKLEQDILYRQMKEAARDPQFIRDMEEAANAFDAADSETARGIPEW
jgi:predicted DNA-binding protein